MKSFHVVCFFLFQLTKQLKQFGVALNKVGSDYDGRLERQNGADDHRGVGFLVESSCGRTSFFTN
jgi:hypothetical protein